VLTGIDFDFVGVAVGYHEVVREQRDERNLMPATH
jgi:hypothetical protein